jgi:adenosine deaminase
VLRTGEDFRQVVVDCGAEAAGHGAVYIEGIFSPAEHVGRGATWDEVLSGFCDGAQEAWEKHGVQVRLTPDVTRDMPPDVAELTAAHSVLDVCPISNLRTRVVPSLGEHPLPALVAAGVACSVSTDDPAMFSTDLGADYAAAIGLGVAPEACFAAGLRGALCDEVTRADIADMGARNDWARAVAASQI